MSKENTEALIAKKGSVDAAISAATPIKVDEIFHLARRLIKASFVGLDPESVDLQELQDIATEMAQAFKLDVETIIEKAEAEIVEREEKALEARNTPRMS